MKVAFVALSAPGHLNPMTALARRFQSRAHDVVLISLPDAEPQASAADLEFLPYGENAFSADCRDEFRHRMSKLQGEDAVRCSIDFLATLTEAALNSLPAALASAGASAVVLDTYQFYVELIPMSLGLPYDSAFVASQAQSFGCQAATVYRDVRSVRGSAGRDRTARSFVAHQEFLPSHCGGPGLTWD